MVHSADLASCAAASSLGLIDIRDITAWIEDPVAPTVTATGGSLPSVYRSTSRTSVAVTR